MKKRLRLFQIALFFLVFVLLTGTTDSVWASKKNIDLKGFDKFVNQHMDEWKVPGLAICILKDGKLIFSEGFGFRDIEKALPVTSNTLFAIGSCTKAFTASAMESWWIKESWIGIHLFKPIYLNLGWLIPLHQNG